MAMAKAAQLGTSLAGYIRRLVAADAASTRTPAGRPSLFDLGESARASDVAAHKDEYVGEAVGAQRR
jgi:hypothetical protein